MGKVIHAADLFCGAAGTDRMTSRRRYTDKELLPTTRRACLKCDRPFQSWNPSKNRICPPCTVANKGLYEAESEIRRAAWGPHVPA